MKKHSLFAAVTGCMVSLCTLHNAEVQAQKIPIRKISTDEQIKARSHLKAVDFPPLTFAKIKGAPTLTPPTMVTTQYGPVETRGTGWAYPEFRDMDQDGKKDLLIGEFGSGLEHGRPVGNFIRVYPNISENGKGIPAFDDEFYYLRPDNDYGYGTPLSLWVWCCMGFKPTFADLNNDGITDIVAGQYNPGDIILFKGTKKGYMPGDRLFQEGDPLGKKKFEGDDEDINPENSMYWYYNTVAVADLTGDGLDDLILGGSCIRISKNIGTKTDPRFGLRKPLLHTDGSTVASGKNGEQHGGAINPVIFDWDNDGIPDLLATFAYLGRASATIMFYKGVKQNGEFRFEKGIPLITANDGGKALPGSHPAITITDWNGDGVMDIVMGTAVATLNDQFDAALSWQWELETGIYQLNPGYFTEPRKRRLKKEMEAADAARKKTGLTEEELDAKRFVSSKSIFNNAYVKSEYKTLKHVGYVYVFLGKK
ncbi:FG-GAP repeat domain-containing protein [Pseudobacter ginsenosidimutans]|uniref:VCBS repeat protein n=1 Tax=Pseudobacter ginsenosidimutans TaxID=661488 RepID=A0A4V2F202_9BACT|nr:VCBS repeat-containing protein [Pseudobacter ginsenosidimutans]QEC44121.1 VCBS repeat-containing protein [Pseudobacter ginsenosidimutans]RZS75566.1 VCBS repeat protein [Pseudobacter ginsenosidimutans]